MKSSNFFVVVISIQAISWVMLFLDIPVVRQVVVFLCFAFIPGMIILKLMNVTELDLLSEVVLSVGLSLAFIMAVGLLMNLISSITGMSEPLSSMNTVLVLSGVLLLLSLLSCLLNRDPDNKFIEKLASVHKNHFVLFSVILLSVIGVAMVNAYGDSSILLLILAIISMLMLIGIVKFKSLTFKFLVSMLFVISISLLLQKSLVSNYIHGFDIQAEYYIASLTKNDAYWNPTAVKGYYSDYSSMLSVTVLPSLYSNLLNLDETWVFKIVFPLIYSFVPLGVYLLSKKHFGTKVALMSAFFFMANYDYFTQPTSNAKQMIAELFYVSLLLLVFERSMKKVSATICFVLLGFGLVTSHYGTSYLFLFLALSIFAVMLLLKRRGTLNLSLIALFSVMAFLWFVYVSDAASFDRLLEMGNNIFRSLSRFFEPQSRGQEVLTAFGLTESPTFWHTMGRFFFYITEVLIAAGLILLVVKRKSNKLDQEYTLLLVANAGILLLCVILPSFAKSFRMERFYGILLLVLAPVGIIGGRTIIKKILKSNGKYWEQILVLSVLIPFFLFQTGFVYEVTLDDVPSSVSLSMYRMGELPYIRYGLLHENDVLGANWLSAFGETRQSEIYSDLVSQQFVLTSHTRYGVLDREQIFSLTNGTLSSKVYVFMGKHNSMTGIIFGSRSAFNITEISSQLKNSNRIYSNGGCEIFRSP